MIYFTSEIKGFSLNNKNEYKRALRRVAKQEGQEIDELHYIFVDDKALLAMNQQYLAHDTLTDILTFDNGEVGDNVIDGDVFISVERVRENAVTFNVSATEELNRVIAHGLLHLCGYADKTNAEQAVMRQKEAEAMAILPR